MFQEISNIFELITQVTSGDAPWWIYAVIFFIPFCILIAIREAYCWFNKVNTVVSRLDRLDKRLRELQSAIMNLSESISNQGKVIVPAPQNTAPTQKVVTQTPPPKEIPQKENLQVDESGEFYLDKNWTNK